MAVLKAAWIKFANSYLNLLLANAYYIVKIYVLLAINLLLDSSLALKSIIYPEETKSIQGLQELKIVGMSKESFLTS